MPSAFAAFEIDHAALIDLDVYPIHDLTSSAREAVVAEARAQMSADGCCRLSGFVRPGAVERMQVEATSLHDRTCWSVQDHNPYFSPDDDSFPAGHPRRTLQHRETGFINSDVLVGDSVLRQLYDSDVLLHFIWECLGTARPIYRWADPLARNPYGVTDPGQWLPWHFDGNEFTVSILAQKAERGGVFEYVPNIRRPDVENYEHVAHVLAGGHDGVRQLDLMPGDLQLFAGRFSLHRVTPVEGTVPRYIGLPSYVHDPYRMNRSFHSETLYGRATDQHRQRERVLVDGLVD
ncbi:MAG: hypothetical protein ABI894_16630 [Ilumatobacteraceae bacterium]